MVALSARSYDLTTEQPTLSATVALDTLMVRLDKAELVGIQCAADAILLAASYDGNEKAFRTMMVEAFSRHDRGKTQAYLYAAAGWQGARRIKRDGGAHLWMDVETYSDAHRAVTAFVVREWHVNSAQDLVDYLRELAAIESNRDEKHGNTKSAAEKLADSVRRLADKDELGADGALMVLRAVLECCGPAQLEEARNAIITRSLSMEKMAAAQQVKLDKLHSDRATRRQIALD